MSHGNWREEGGRRIDWGQTSRDYAHFRQGYPDSFFERLGALGVGLPGQDVLDLGTGTGLVARAFAARGCRVTGVDIAGEQIAHAEALARDAGLDAEFRVAPAEDTGAPDASADIVSASACFHYFDKPRALAEIARVLRPNGLFFDAYLCWLPRRDAIARRTEELVLTYSPAWSSADWDGVIPPKPAWLPESWTLRAMFAYDEDLHFTKEGWRGRMRACRGVGATLTPDEVAAFDAEHAELLDRAVDEEPFPIRHRVVARVMSPEGW